MPYPGEEIIHIQKFTTSLTHRGDMKVVGVGEGLWLRTGVMGLEVVGWSCIEVCIGLMGRS